MSILETLDGITIKDREMTQRVLDFFLPLRERFVTTIIKPKIIKKKFLWFEWETYGESYTDYMPLIIDVTRNSFSGKFFVKITHYIGGGRVPRWIGKEFEVSMFQHDDSYIASEDSIKEFISEIKSTGITPKYVHYDEFVGHIRDESKKLYVSNKLEQLFASDEYTELKNTLADQVKIGDWLRDKIKEWENE